MHDKQELIRQMDAARSRYREAQNNLEAATTRVRDFARQEFTDALAANKGITDLPAKVVINQRGRTYGPFYLIGVHTSRHDPMTAYASLRAIKKDGTPSEREPSWRDRPSDVILPDQIEAAP